MLDELQLFSAYQQDLLSLLKVLPVESQRALELGPVVVQASVSVSVPVAESASVPEQEPVVEPVQESALELELNLESELVLVLLPDQV